MKFIWRNNNIFLLFFFMFSISIVLFGCSQDKEVKQSTLLLEKTYQVQEIEGIENFIIYAMDSREKTLYLLGTSKEQKNNTEMEIMIIAAEGEESSKIVIHDIEKSSSVFFKKTENGYFLLKMKEIGSYEFFTLKEDGSIEKRVMLSLDKTINIDKIDIRLVQFSENGEIYALDYNGDLCLFGKNGKLEKIVKLEQGMAVSDMLLKEDSIYFTRMVPAGRELKLSEYTIESLKKAKNKEIGKEISYKTGITFYGNCYLMLSQEDTWDFYIRSSTDIYGYSLNTQKAENICNWLNNDIEGTDVKQVLSFSKNCFYVLLEEINNTSNIKQQIFSFYPTEEIQQKQILTLAVQQQLSEISEMVVEYNKQNENTRIVVKDYSQMENPTQAMNNDIISGQIPDMVDMRTLNVEDYSKKGLLLDLTDWLEKDSEISESDFIDSIINVLKIENKLYFIPASFSITALAGSKGTIEERTSWTLDEFRQLYQNKDKKQMLFGNKTKERLFISICNSMLDEFINWKQGEANFKNETFEKLLSFIKDFSEESTATNLFAEMQEGNVLLAELLIGNLEQNYSFYKALFPDMQLIGMPSNYGSGISAKSYMPMIAITTSCSQQEEAFEFLKKYWEYDYQKKWADSLWEFPIRKDVLKKKLEYASATKSYTNEDGEVIPAVDKNVNYGLEVHIEPLNKKDNQILQDFINRIERFDYENSDRKDILAIILEESQSYFKESKTIKETEDIIQSRVTLYLNEKR